MVMFERWRNISSYDFLLVLNEDLASNLDRDKREEQGFAVLSVIINKILIL